MNGFELCRYLKGEKLGLKGSFPQVSRIKYILKAPRIKGVANAALIIHSDEYKEDFSEDIIDFEWTDLEEGYDVYEAELDLSKYPLGLYFYNVNINFGGKDHLLFEKFDYQRQILIYDNDYVLPKNNGGIIYHIFVDRFYKSGKSPVKKGNIMNSDWENGIPQYGEKPGAPVLNNEFFGGDLYGIAEKLPYISSLGTKYIYLSPIFDAFSNHKYDTGNYMAVDEGFGGDKALEYLIKEAEKYGIKVILDGVFNHTGDDSLYFDKYKKYGGLGAYNSQKSPYFEWYNFRKFPDDYECWWNIKILPRVNSANKNYIDFITGEKSVIKKWMDMGIGGWRLDVADELSDAFLENLRKRVKKENAEALIIGEVWEDASNKISYGERRKYFWGNQIDGVMNYPLREAILNLIKYDDVKGFIRVLKILTAHYPEEVLNCNMNLLGTHDTVRLITYLAGDEENPDDNEKLSKKCLTQKQFENGVHDVETAFGIMYFLPGIPCVYYGDEIGMEGYHDPFCRRPFKWSEVKSSKLLKYMKKLGKIRIEEKALRDSTIEFVYEDENSFVLKRQKGKEAIILIFNGKKDRISACFDKDGINLINGRKVKNICPECGDCAMIKISSETKIAIIK